MPPLPKYRALAEVNGGAQFVINEWEPALACSGNLLITPSKLSVRRDIGFLALDSASGSSNTVYDDYETRLNSAGQVIQHHEVSVSAYGNKHEALAYYDRESDRFGYTVPKLETWTHAMVRTGEINPDYSLSQATDGTITFIDSSSRADIKKQDATDGTGVTTWITKLTDYRGDSTFVETFDESGRFLTAVYDIHDQYGERREEIRFIYDDDGLLIQEEKSVREGDSGENGKPSDRVETTTYQHDANSVHITTTLQDGTVIREATRKYDKDGRLEGMVMKENIPGQNRERVTTVDPESYDPILENLRTRAFFF